MVQEPWIHQDRVCGLKIKGYKLLFAKGTGNNRIRSCILAKTSLNIFILSDFSDEDTVTAAWETPVGTIWVISSYMAHDHGDSPPNEIVKRAVNMANSTNTPIIICADANAHHIIWGSTNTNPRGECLLDYILSSNLEVVNIGSEPTFIVANRMEVLDLTLISSRHCSLIRDWKVSDDCSFSDHRYIVFEIGVAESSPPPILNRRKTNWELQNRVLSVHLTNPPTVTDSREIENAVNFLTESIRSATNVACKPSIRRGKDKPSWWNPEIARTRSACRKLFNMAKRSGDWSAYKTSINRFKNLIRNAKRKAWRTFCNSVETSSETNRLRKILSATTAVPSYIQKPCGKWTVDSRETLDVLLDAHFPDSLPVSHADQEVAHTQSESNVAIDIDDHKLR